MTRLPDFIAFTAVRLTEPQHEMLFRASKMDDGAIVRGADRWATARSLARRGLGEILGSACGVESARFCINAAGRARLAAKERSR